MLHTRFSLGLPDDDRETVRVVREAVIGEGALLDGPYGPRRVVYLDYAASGRAVSFIEDYVRDEVLPYYANTHTEASGLGERTTELREDARRSIGAALGAGVEDVVVFCGSGSSAAIDKLIAVLNLRIPRELEARHRLSERIPERERPVVFVGPHEHHSNELAWRESLATVVAIPEDARGEMDLGALGAALVRYSGRTRKFGSFSAASNVTGQLADVARVTRLLHAHGALAFWDYAAAAPYVDIEMYGRGGRGVADPTAYKDAVFLSPHKFIGGPSTPGVLVVRRELMTNRVPDVPRAPQGSRGRR
jgi:selenocysteine lyase/cysteine desulfurase